MCAGRLLSSYSTRPSGSKIVVPQIDGALAVMMVPRGGEPVVVVKIPPPGIRIEGGDCGWDGKGTRDVVPVQSFPHRRGPDRCHRELRPTSHRRPALHGGVVRIHRRQAAGSRPPEAPRGMPRSSVHRRGSSAGGMHRQPPTSDVVPRVTLFGVRVDRCSFGTLSHGIGCCRRDRVCPLRSRERDLGDVRGFVVYPG